ncbi:MAG: ABC-F family ATP-binding cassette domain-containing protein [Chloroflexi bacterium]|nr:ABC-F family ATP-binding cassette domain-containing protein [Chloroflexota bacterium]
MSLITATSLSKSFGAEDIFRGVTFSVPKGARLAIVGPNGCGKTTLLRILIGDEEASSGTVTRARSARIGYLSQEADFQMEGTLWEACLSPFASLIQQQDELHRLESQMVNASSDLLERYGKLQHDFERRGGYTYVTRIKQVLTGLGFDASDYDMRLDHLSGGQRTRAFLSRLLLSDPDLLLLDEPTNHLDIRAVEWLESYLAQWDGAAVIVSHDRYFLDRAANVILEMRPDGAEVYRGNYTHYLQQREERWNRREEIFNSEKEKLIKEVEYIKKNISGQNTLQAKGKLKRLTRVVQAIEQLGMDAVVNSNWSQLGVETTTSPFGVEEAERHVRALRLPDNRPPKFHLRLKTASRSGELVLRTKNLKVGYPPDKERGDAGKFLFAAEDITLRRQDCAALIGPNGAGKTTFLKTALENLAPLGGEVIMGASLHIGYFAQAHEGLDPRKTLMQEIQSVRPEFLIHEVRDLLGKFLFSGDDAFKLVDMLSGGERGRLALAKLALQQTNFLLLDEPTNHLDIPAQEVLQSVLDNYEGTILLVSHDRYLIDALATQIWEIQQTSQVSEACEVSQLVVYNGTYSQMKEEREKQAARLAEQNDIRYSKVDDRISNIEYRKSKSAKSKEERRRVAQLQELENAIAALEADLANLGAQLESPFVNPKEVAVIGKEYERVQKEMDEKLREWERLQG